MRSAGTRGPALAAADVGADRRRPLAPAGRAHVAGLQRPRPRRGDGGLRRRRRAAPIQPDRRGLARAGRAPARPICSARSASRCRPQAATSSWSSCSTAPASGIRAQRHPGQPEPAGAGRETQLRIFSGSCRSLAHVSRAAREAVIGDDSADPEVLDAFVDALHRRNPRDRRQPATTPLRALVLLGRRRPRRRRTSATPTCSPATTSTTPGERGRGAIRRRTPPQQVRAARSPSCSP